MSDAKVYDVATWRPRKGHREALAELRRVTGAPTDTAVIVEALRVFGQKHGVAVPPLTDGRRRRQEA